MSGAGENPWGYTKSENVPGEDGRPVAAEFSQLWPAGTPGIGAGRAPGGQMQQPRTQVEPAPSKQGGKRPKRRAVPKPRKPAPYKTPKGK